MGPSLLAETHIACSRCIECYKNVATKYTTVHIYLQFASWRCKYKNKLKAEKWRWTFESCWRQHTSAHADIGIYYSNIMSRWISYNIRPFAGFTIRCHFRRYLHVHWTTKVRTQKKNEKTVDIRISPSLLFFSRPCERNSVNENRNASVNHRISQVPFPQWYPKLTLQHKI